VANGEPVAVRDSTGIDMVSADHRGTPVLMVDGQTATVTRRRFSPFGEQLGIPAAWPTDRQFLNKIADPTGYSHLDAREYDPSLGRFLSVDPIADFNDSQQINGYAYANNNPVTTADPMGTLPGIFGDPSHWWDLSHLVPPTPSALNNPTGGNKIFPTLPSRNFDLSQWASLTRAANERNQQQVIARQQAAQRFDNKKKCPNCVDAGGWERLKRSAWGEVGPGAWLAQASSFKGSVTEMMGFPGSRAIGRMLGPFGAAGVQMLDDVGRSDLTDTQ
jgi:RHS repeat-associated protein